MLYCIRSYESSWTSVHRPYYGAYQFRIDTWNGVAGRWVPRLRGVRPDRASRADQSLMASWLYRESGLGPWSAKAKRYCAQNPPRPRGH